MSLVPNIIKGRYLEINFTSSKEVFTWLDQFINLERGHKPKSFRIDRMHFLCELAGHPERCAPSIHVAGSKGKGSVTAMLTSMLTAAGYRAARYMSPHVIDIRERICIGDSYLSEEIYCAAGNDLRKITEVLLPAAENPLFDNEREDGCEPTYFELLTLFFFLCARHANCDVMVVETGMGGRLDSTNVLDPLVSVITLIELEHTAFLGDTITAVATEKAGIIKQGKPLILAKQCEEALEVFKKATQEKKSPLIYLPMIAEISNLKIKPHGTDFTLLFKGQGTALQAQDRGQGIVVSNLNLDQYDTRTDKNPVPCPSSLVPLFIPIPGKVQAENAALAITALKIAFPSINEEAIRIGLANLKLPARFEKIRDNPPLIIDGAHTPESLDGCIEAFCSLYGEGGVLIFGCAADKDAAAMARIVCARFARIFITSIGAYKTNEPQKVYESFCAQAGEKVQLVMDTWEAVKQAKNFAQEKNLPILATGSFYLAANIRSLR